MSTTPRPAATITSEGHTPSPARALATVPALWIAGAAFVVYPAVRPFSDEVSRSGAIAFASPRWTIAHTFGIVAFTLLGLGLSRPPGRSCRVPRLTLLPLTIAVALYIPQFAATQPVRVADGMLMAAGYLLLAYGITARLDAAAAPRGGQQ